MAATLRGLARPATAIALQLPDGPGVHATMLACEKAGLVAVGIGSRAGEREVAHLVERTRRATLAARSRHALTLPGVEHPIGARRPVVPQLDVGHHRPAQDRRCTTRRAGSRSTSSRTASRTSPPTTCSAQRAARRRSASGCGPRTSRPTIVGAPCVVCARFDADDVLAAIERYRVTVLAAVSTQFVMMLNSPAIDRVRPVVAADHVHRRRDGALRARQGVRGPHRRERAAVLRHRTRPARCRARRRTIRRRSGCAPRAGSSPRCTCASSTPTPAPTSPRPADPACPRARARRCASATGTTTPPTSELFTADGWMRMGDLATIDADGYLTVVGRTSDLIIRGGKNISAAQVEDEVASHPAVALCARGRGPRPDVRGAGVRVRRAAPGSRPDHPRRAARPPPPRGTGKELWPERLVVLDAFPRSSGGKVAKGELRSVGVGVLPGGYPSRGRLSILVFCVALAATSAVGAAAGRAAGRGPEARRLRVPLRHRLAARRGGNALLLRRAGTAQPRATLHARHSVHGLGHGRAGAPREDGSVHHHRQQPAAARSRRSRSCRDGYRRR